MSPTETIQSIYAAFGTGDVPTILDLVSEDTRWGFAGARPDRVPYHAPVEGRAALPAFFASLAENVRFERFVPTTFVEGARDVAVKVEMAFTFVSSGRRVEQTQVHGWQLDDAGRVVGMTHFEDTAQTIAAA